MRLSQATVKSLSEGVARPAYDRAVQDKGIVHLGLGAFARAHLAAYTDAAMSEGDGGWMITGVSLRSANVACQLNPQDGLYLVAERSKSGTSYRLTAAVAEVLVAPHQGDEVIAAMAAPSAKIISFTITEKGYCRAPDGSLDMALAESGSIYPLLAEAFRRRKNAGLDGLTLLSCDNLAANGTVLRQLVGQYLSAQSLELLEWFERNCTCPCAMVDRIVPATIPSNVEQAALATGLRDEGLVVTEPFSQWVIEDDFANGRPRWEDVGAQLVSDVRPYETAKLRLLNGAHSLLAYCGLEAGHETVDQAIRDPALRELVLRYMLDEAAPTIAIAPGQDLQAYCESLIERFENPSLDHRLAQIAMDGSQKIPQRWLTVLAERKAKDQKSPMIFAALAAWLRYVGSGLKVEDPLAQSLADVWDRHPDKTLIEVIFGKCGLVSSAWQPDDSEIEALYGLVGSQITCTRLRHGCAP